MSLGQKAKLEQALAYGPKDLEVSQDFFTRVPTCKLKCKDMTVQLLAAQFSCGLSAKGPS
jgi:hypothetical protein